MPENGGIYDRQVAEGKAAKPGTQCPFLNSELGARCAWLAGHYDAHGYTAWDLARQTASERPRFDTGCAALAAHRKKGGNDV